MRTSGEVALASATRTLNAALAQPGVDAMRVAEDFFGLSDLVREDARLRRGMTDPARSVDDKRALSRGAVGSVVTATTATVLDDLVASHWSDPMDLHDACEVLGIIATMEDARRNNALETVGQELFAVADFLADYRDLRLELSDMGHGNRHERGDLAQSIFKDQLTKWTMRLVRRGVGRTSHGRLLSTLRRFAERAASMMNSVLVSVQAAAPMTDAQIERLRAVLTRKLGRDVTLTVSIDPALVGGFRFEVGNTALDSSIQTQLNDLRRALVGSR